ncbi:hypothetical protein GCM10010340_16150 [Streptomyces griseoloalbus]|nr:hypothetical protein GCM10010340_16150 [Streptomyces albaduncus]
MSTYLTRLMNRSKRTYPDLRCGGGIETRAVFADADPSIPARGEHRQYMRGDLEVNGQPARFRTVENGVATPRQMRSRPGRGCADDRHRVRPGRVRPGQPVPRRPGHGQRDVPVGIGDLSRSTCATAEFSCHP